MSNVYSLPQSVSQNGNAAVAPNPIPSQPQVMPVSGNAVQQPVQPVNTAVQPVPSENAKPAPSFPSEAELQERVKETNSATMVTQELTQSQQVSVMSAPNPVSVSAPTPVSMSAPTPVSVTSAPTPVSSISTMSVNEGQYVAQYSSYPAQYDPNMYQPVYQQQYQQYQQQYQPVYQPQYQPMYMPQYQPKYQPQYQPPQQQQQVACPSCHTQLVPPAGAEIFKCPCGQVLRNPYVASSSSVSSDEQMKKKQRNQNLKDAGLGIG